jgi:hypothetical protein
MKVATLALLFALAGCQSGALSPGVPGASSVGTLGLNGTPNGRPDHLYVSVAPASDPNYTSVERFRLVNGIPRSKPDRIYSGGQGMLDIIAVSSDGTLYATGLFSESLTVYAFDGGNTKPDRTIQVPYPHHCGSFSSRATEISALATDPQGNLFVGILTFDQEASRRVAATVSPEASVHAPCNGVAIFAPNAKGQAKPIQSIDLGRLGWVNSLAVDTKDNLYVGDYPTNILEYANAVQGPKEIRLLHAHSADWVSALATDAAGDIFIANTNYQSAVIDRYAPGASQGPNNEIQLSGSGFHTLQSIAVRGRDLYAQDQISSIDLYHARKNGPQSPFYSLATSGYFRFVAVGP